jgi:hypothetical protein
MTTPSREKVGQLMKDDSAPSAATAIRITRILAPGVIYCDATNTEFGRTYMRVDGETYDEASADRHDAGNFHFRWAASGGPDEKRVGKLRFATAEEEEIEQVQIKRYRDEIAARGQALQRWMPGLSDEQAQSFAKRPRIMRESEKLVGITSDGAFLEWLLTPTY